jgi:mRNA-degrading endonuclease RelE of RelBE toxin-antitoxin system
MEFIETSLFTKLVQQYLDDDVYHELQLYLLNYPESGDVVPGSGGVRKIRWGAKSKGKRGGVRVIYFWKTLHNEIWLLTIYAKGQRETIPAHILKQIAEEIKHV